MGIARLPKGTTLGVFVLLAACSGNAASPAAPFVGAVSPGEAQSRISAEGTSRMVQISLHQVYPSEASPVNLTVGSDDRIWYTELSPLTPALLNIPTRAQQSGYGILIQNASGTFNSITSGSDGALYLTVESSAIGRFDIKTQAYVEYTVPTANALPEGITPGPDGALWFTEQTANKIGRMTTSGAMTEYPIPTAGAMPLNIVTGPDGALWFTETGATNIGRLNTKGAFHEYALPKDTYGGTFAITAGPDGALWFTEGSGVGRLTTAGKYTHIPLPGYVFDGITSARDGALWVAATSEQAIVRITTSGTATIYPIPKGGSDLYPEGIVAGPQGDDLWFADSSLEYSTNVTGAIGQVIDPFPHATTGQVPLRHTR